MKTDNPEAFVGEVLAIRGDTVTYLYEVCLVESRTFYPTPGSILRRDTSESPEWEPYTYRTAYTAGFSIGNSEVPTWEEVTAYCKASLV